MRCLIRPIRRRSKRDPIRRLSRRRVLGLEKVVVRVAMGVVVRRMERIMGKNRRPSPESSRDFRREKGRMG